MATTVYDWQIDGVSLHTYAWNIKTLGGRLKTPSLKGENDELAYAHGERWNPKYDAGKTLPLAMWMRGWGPNEGDVATSPTWKFYENFDQFVRTISDGTRQHTLTKKWPDANGNVLSAEARVEFPNGIDIDMQTVAMGVFVLDCYLPDPYFYGPVETLTVNAGQTLTYTPKGHKLGSGFGAEIDFVGQLSNGTLYYGINDTDPFVKVSLDIAIGDKVTVNCADFLAFRDSDDQNVTGAVSRGFQHGWLAVGRNAPNTEKLRLVTDAGTGKVDLRYRPAYH